VIGLAVTAALLVWALWGIKPREVIAHVRDKVEASLRER